MALLGVRVVGGIRGVVDEAVKDDGKLLVRSGRT